MADEFNINNPGISHFSIKKLTKNLQISRRKLVKILQFSTEKGRLIADINKDNIILNCPRLKELCDNWTQKLLRSNFEVKKKLLKPKEVEVRSKTKEEDIKKENNKKENAFYPLKNFDNNYQKYLKQTKEIMQYLNSKANKNFPLEPHLYIGIESIIERLATGKTVEQHIIIIDKKIKDNNFNRNWLRPETLFKKENFDKYLYEDEKNYKDDNKETSGIGSLDATKQLAEEWGKHE